MTKWDFYSMNAKINVIYSINRTKDNNHIIILIDAEKTFDQIQHILMMKILNN